jgi:hypothetical protein
LERKPDRKKYIRKELKFKSATDPTVRVMKAFDGSKFTDSEIEEYSRRFYNGIDQGSGWLFLLSSIIMGKDSIWTTQLGFYLGR